jgi:site-specific recombinase XerC
MKQRKLLQIKAKSEISSDKNSADFTVPASATKTVCEVPENGASFVSDGDELGQNSEIVSPVGEPARFSPTKKMPLPEDNSSAALIGFTLPKLHKGKNWYVDFFAYDPVTDRMKRKKYMLDRQKKKGERHIMATMLITNITQRLIKGWNPWVRNDSTRHLAQFSEVLASYREYIEALETRGTLRHKTAYDYLSRLGAIESYIQECHVAIRFVYQFDQAFVVDFLDYLILDKDVSATTRNNYRTWLSTFGTWLVERRYLTGNPVEGTHMLREKEKLRDALPAQALARMREYLNKNNRYFLLACMMEYYTFIRPDELRHIRIGNISVTDMEVTVPADVSKNHRERHVGLNAKILRLMNELRTFDSPSQYYLFSDSLKPGQDMVYLNRFRYEWKKMRTALRWPESYQFYSLKDAGIRDLANAEGVVVARDQAGHSDVAVTNRYLKQGKAVPESVKSFDGLL